MFRRVSGVLGVAVLIVGGCWKASQSGLPPTTPALPTVPVQAGESRTNMPSTARTEPLPTQPQPTKPLIADRSDPKWKQVEGKFVRFTEKPGTGGKPFYSIIVELKNVTGKDITKYQGGLCFRDENGRELYVLGWTKDALKAGTPRQDGFMPLLIKEDSVKYMKEHPEKVKVEFEASNITFSDGTEKKFGR